MHRKTGPARLFFGLREDVVAPLLAFLLITFGLVLGANLENAFSIYLAIASIGLLSFCITLPTLLRVAGG